MTGQRKGRIETLACELAAGKTVEQAMLAAGYSAKTAAQGRIRHGERLVSPANHPNVAVRMDEIRAAARESSRLTVHDIVAKLERSFRGAVADGKWSAATQAAMGQARVLGLLVDRKQIEIPPISEMTEQQLVALLGDEAEGGG